MTATEIRLEFLVGMCIKGGNNLKRKKGYVLVYSLIAMTLACTLVLSTVSIVLYYGNNMNRTIGANGARYVADSGVCALENYLNEYYIDKGNLKTNVSDLWVTTYDIVDEIVPVVGEGHDQKALLALEGYLNYNYITSSSSRTKSLNADEKISGAYKVFISESQKRRIRSEGYITILSIGEYVYQNKSYYKFLTVGAIIEPVYHAGMIVSLKLKTVDYIETIKGGTNLWGNVAW